VTTNDYSNDRYLLITANAMNFDERPIERRFDDAAKAKKAARAFMRKATCAGARATVFDNGWTIYHKGAK
jgi:hypothetical protein